MVKMVLLSMMGLCKLGGGDGLTARWIKCCLKVCPILRVIGLFCMARASATDRNFRKTFFWLRTNRGCYH